MSEEEVKNFLLNTLNFTKLDIEKLEIFRKKLLKYNSEILKE